ncbi:S-locus lectin protein kinase family protein [Prunus dulcis]|uniref:S-locus lectin protein kinase family protein n=1 Tax=Prunus dulcis TaxID=3755 RepID=A0A4Y1QUK0_PRUDU|nr:S-locus lectin protein kinase family protein [Prunus dulcis]
MISDPPYIVQTKRNTPLTGSSGALKLSSPGILVPAVHKNTTVFQHIKFFTESSGTDFRFRKSSCDRWQWSPQDPSQGHYPYQLGPYGYHELILREGSVIKYRTAPWNGIQFSGMHNLNPTYDFVLDNDDEVYYGYKLLNSSTLFRLALTQDGFGPSYIRSDGNQGWVVYLRATTDICDKYGICGPNCACCIDKSPLCSCLKGFIPTFKKTGSCWIGHIDECEMMCMNNCSCAAFSNLDIRDGGRVLAVVQRSDQGHNTKIIVTSTVLSTGLLILGLTLLLYVRKNQQQKYGELKPGQKEDLELPLFDLAAVVSLYYKYDLLQGEEYTENSHKQIFSHSFHILAWYQSSDLGIADSSFKPPPLLWGLMIFSTLMEVAPPTPSLILHQPSLS